MYYVKNMNKLSIGVAVIVSITLISIIVWWAKRGYFLEKSHTPTTVPITPPVPIQETSLAPMLQLTPQTTSTSAIATTTPVSPLASILAGPTPSTPVSVQVLSPLAPVLAPIPTSALTPTTVPVVPVPIQETSPLAPVLSSTSTPKQVTLYGDCGYGGWAKSFSAGDYKWVGDVGVPNDSVSSVKVPSGCTLTLFGDINFGGPSLTLTSDVSCLVDKNF